jgi:phosphotransferase system HPr-like phosphotransfer protein
MTERRIKLSTIDDVKLFVAAVTTFGGDVDVVQGRYTVDAKSALGLLSLKLTEELVLRIYTQPGDYECGDLLAELDEFVIKE